MREAGARTGASLHVNGIDPGFANDVLPLTAASPALAVLTRPRLPRTPDQQLRAEGLLLASYAFLDHKSDPKPAELRRSACQLGPVLPSVLPDVSQR